MTEELKYVQAHGNGNNPKLMILSDSPSEKDVAVGRCMSSEYDLDRLLREAKISKSDCWLSTVSKYHVPPNFGEKKIPFQTRAKTAGINLQEQIEHLQIEINNVQPNCILALGGPPLWALAGKKGIDDYRGSILYGMGRKFVPTYHPRGLSWSKDSEFKGYWNRQIIMFDILRAKRQSDFSEILRPARLLRVCKSSYELNEFIMRKSDKTRLGLDIEALRCIPTCLGLAFDRHEGLSVPLLSLIHI